MSPELREEFDQYLKENSDWAEGFALPPQFTGYLLISCLQDDPDKKTFLLQGADNRKILCKFACGEFRAMLKAENEISHIGKFPFLPYVIHYHETENSSVLFREYIEGRTLSELVAENGSIELARAVSILRKLCHSLACFHDMEPPLIYRDIKPSNIVLTKQGDCYLVDMGTVRRYQPGISSDTFCMGTMDCAAPEQFGARQTDSRTDIYGLGILFYYLLTKELKIQEELLAKLPSSASSIIKKCTAFSPDDRYENVHQLDAALKKIYPDRKYLKYRSWAIAASACSAVLFLLLIFNTRGTKAPVSTADTIAALSEGPSAEIPLETPTTVIISPETSPVEITEPETAEPDTVGAETINPEPSAVQPPLEKPALTDENGAVIFRSPLLEQAIREAIGKSAKEPIYPEELKQITALSICGDTVLQEGSLHNSYLDPHQVNGNAAEKGDISDISLLSLMPNLHYLTLDYQKIYDLSPLAELELVSLSLSGNPVSDLSPLSGCGSLNYLDIARTSVVNLAPLSGCAGLTELVCSYSPVNSLAPLEGLNLRSIEMREIPATDFAVMEKLPLNRVVCDRVSPTVVPYLCKLDSLWELSVCGCGIRSLEELSGLTGLHLLNASSNSIHDLDGISALPSLNTLWVSENPISDFSQLKSMPGLTQLSVARTNVSDFSFLNETPNISTLLIQETQRAAVEAAVPEPWFTIEIW